MSMNTTTSTAFLTTSCQKAIRRYRHHHPHHPFHYYAKRRTSVFVSTATKFKRLLWLSTTPHDCNILIIVNHSSTQLWGQKQSSLFHNNGHDDDEQQNDNNVQQDITTTLEDTTTTAHELAKNSFSFLARRGKTWERLKHMVDLALLLPEQERPIPTTIADIGTDHGLLAISLGLSGKFEKVIGIDVSENALRNGAFQVIQQNYEQLSPHVKIINNTILTRQEEQDINKHNVDQKQYPPPMVELDFRVGSGLVPLDEGEADIICIAGMGVNTMLKILLYHETTTTTIEATNCKNNSSGGNNSKDDLNHHQQQQQNLDRINCQYLLLQPTNSKPRNLILLYTKLQQLGWILMDERIVFVSSRWYLSVLFQKRQQQQQQQEQQEETVLFDLPCSRLRNKFIGNTNSFNNNPSFKGEEETEEEQFLKMKHTFQDYVRHHTDWIQGDLQKKKKKRRGKANNTNGDDSFLDQEELRWLETMVSLLD